MMRFNTQRWFNKAVFFKLLLVAFLFNFNLSFANNDTIKPLSLTVDHGTPMRLPEPAATIAIGNPDFFNIVTLENNLLMLTGANEGVTSLTIIGKSGQIYQYRVKVTIDLQQIKDQFKWQQQQQQQELEAQFNRQQQVESFEILRTETEAQRLLQKLRNLIEPLEPNVTIEDLNGKVILRGEVQTPAALVRVLTIADRFYGGKDPQPDFKVVSDYGGVLAGNLDEKVSTLDPTLFSPLAQSARSGSIATNRILDEKANLAQNVSRASVVSVANGKVLSIIKVISQPKVEIQMRIVEIDRSKTDQFGIDWRLDGSKVMIGSKVGKVVDVLPSPRTATDGSSFIDSGSSNLVGIFRPGNYFLSTFVNILETKGAVSTLSEPLLTAVSGESARFLVGGSVPIVTQTLSAGNATSNAQTATNASFIQFGLQITVRPTVLENGKISIILEQSISEPDYANAIQVVGATIPGFRQKAVSTVTESDSGETWAVAGLLTEEDRKSLESVPWISKVPILGKLFETKDDSISRNELIILVNARRIDSPNTTTTNFDAKGKLTPSSERETNMAPKDSDHPNNEMSSNHLQDPSKKPEQTPPEIENVEKPINLNKNPKEKNNLSTPIGKSKKLALKQGAQTIGNKQLEIDSIKIVNLKEKSAAPTNEQATTKSEPVKAESNEVAQVFSFDTDRLIKEVIEKKSSAHVVSTQAATEKNTAIVPEEKSVTTNSVPTLEAKKEQPKVDSMKAEPKVIHVADAKVSTPVKSGEKFTQKPVLPETKPQTPLASTKSVEITETFTSQKTPSATNDSAPKNTTVTEKNSKANVVVINFLSAQEKNEYFKGALKKGVANVPPKSQWPNWKIGVGAIDGDVNNVVQFAVPPDMRSKIYSGANVYVELPKSHTSYAVDY